MSTIQARQLQRIVEDFVAELDRQRALEEAFTRDFEKKTKGREEHEANGASPEELETWDRVIERSLWKATAARQEADRLHRTLVQLRQAERTYLGTNNGE